jgi:hypothetical protein
MLNRHEIRVARVIRQVRHMGQKLRIILEHLSTPPVFNGVSCCWIFSFMRSVSQIVVCPFVPFFGHYIVCPYGFWLPLWYLKTLTWLVYITDHANVLSMLMLSFILWQCVICWIEATMYNSLNVCLYLYCHWISHYRDVGCGTH